MAGMTKAKLVTYLAGKVELPKKAVASLLDELATVATKETKSAGQFTIPGIGKAVKVSRKARVGRNPQTGESIKIPARTVVRFRVAKAFKDSILPAKRK